MVKYGKKCNIDENCSSGICEMTYDDAGVAKGRLCVIQEPTYGKKCRYNKDCVSNRCTQTYSEQGDHQGKRCVVVKGMVIPKRGWPFDDDGVPDMLRSSKKQAAVRNTEHVLSNTEKAKAFQGRGPVSEFVVLIMEIIISLVAKIVDIMWIVWSGIFKLVYDFTFGAIQFNKVFGWWSKYTCFDTTIFRYLITFLFPPLGVFMKRGITGFGYILLCCILTMLFYFPGLIYAIIIMTEGEIKCPNKIKGGGAINTDMDQRSGENKARGLGSSALSAR